MKMIHWLEATSGRKNVMAKWESGKWIVWHSDFAVLSLERSTDPTLWQQVQLKGRSLGTTHMSSTGKWGRWKCSPISHGLCQLLSTVAQVNSGETPPLQGKVRAGFGQGWTPEMGYVPLAKCRSSKAQQRCWNGAETAPSCCLSVALPQSQSRKALNTS